MSLARAISRGRPLKARFAVNGIQKASRSLGTAVVAEVFCAWAMAISLLGRRRVDYPLSRIMTKEGVADTNALNFQARRTVRMADKSNKLKARKPRGLEDRGPAEIAATRRMVETIRQVYER